MTEADTESIWDTSLDTTRFGKIGVRIAEFINFKLYGDATTQCTDTAVTPLLEEFSEEVLLKLINSAKAYGVTNPWDFIRANVSIYLIEHYGYWKNTFDDIKKKLSQTETIEITSISGLGASNDI